MVVQTFQSSFILQSEFDHDCDFRKRGILFMQVPGDFRHIKLAKKFLQNKQNKNGWFEHFYQVIPLDYKEQWLKQVKVNQILSGSCDLCQIVIYRNTYL